MKKRTPSLPILVMVAVVALVLGTFGTATAAGLTKGQVKKIAAKVGKKKAKTLTVANSDKVDGYDADDLARATGVTIDNSLGSFDHSAYTDILTKNVTAPGPGILVITGTFEFNELAGNANEAF